MTAWFPSKTVQELPIGKKERKKHSNAIKSIIIRRPLLEFQKNMSTDLPRQQNLGKFSMKELDPMFSPAENMFKKSTYYGNIIP